MKKTFNTLLLTFVFTIALASRQSTPAFAQNKPARSHRLSAKQSRLIQATEILDDHSSGEVARKEYNDSQIKNFIVAKVHDSVPLKYQAQSKKIGDTIMAQSSVYHMDPLFIMAVIEHESKFNPEAKGHFGEQGLMQVKPTTAKWIAKKYKLAIGKQYSLYNPLNNIRFGMAYLDYLRKKFHNTGQFYIEAYNMGPQGVNLAMKNRNVRKAYQKQVRNHYLALYQQIDQVKFEPTFSERYPRLAYVRAKIKQLFS